MNKSYRTIWCEKTGTYVAAAETTRARSRKIGGSILAAVAMLLGGEMEMARAGELDGGTTTITDKDLQLVIGPGAQTTYAKNVAIGPNAQALGGAYDGGYNTAIGYGAHAQTSSGDWGFNTAIGASSVATGYNNTALGAEASATAGNSTAVGQGASATALNSVALGRNAVADRATTVSVGNSSTQRQVVNMAKGTADTDAVNVSQLKGVTTALGGGAAVNANGTILAPAYAVAGGTQSDVGAALSALDAATVQFNGTGGGANVLGKKIVNVGAGALSASSTDAVNGSQLFATNQQVSTNTSNIANNTSAITTLTNNINSGEVGLVLQDQVNRTITVAKDKDGDLVDITGSAGTRQLTGVRSGRVTATSTDAVNGSQLYATNQQVSANTTNIANATTAITNLTNNISNGEVGLVLQDQTTRTITVAKDKDGDQVDFTGTNGARQLNGVADGTVAAGSLFAVNGGQLYGVSSSIAAALGGGSVVNQDGTISAPTYNVGGTTVNTVAGAITNIDSRVTTVENSVTNITNQINNGEVGLVKQDAATGNITVAADKGGNVIDVSGTDGDRKITGVADGTIGEGSTDLVNGGQIYELTQQLGNVSTATSYFTADGANDGSDKAVVQTGTNGVAIGANASVQANNSVALGAGSVADRADTVSVGSAGAERQITNVARATQDTDAVNLGQLKDYSSQVTNNAVSQANAYTNQMTDAVRQDANAGVAAAMAMAGLPQATLPGKGMVAMAGSTYEGQSALALGVSRMSQSGKWVVKLTGSTNTRGNAGVTVGAGFHW